MLITLNYNKPIILIDSSYYVFYRYFATYKWFTMQKKNMKELSEEDFANSFIKHLSSDIKKLTKKWKTEEYNIIFCNDCPRSKIWRNDIYNEYKNNRQVNNNFNQNIFKVFNNHISEKKFNIINIDRLEADDIVYFVHLTIKPRLLNKQIIIITNDNDYLQLCCDGTEIINMQFKNIKLRTNLINGISNLYYKALIGDKSDNIPKISSFINKDLAFQLAQYEKNNLFKWLTEKNLYDKFDFNLRLIAFSHIPIEYLKLFNDTYQFDIKNLDEQNNKI